jgi:hypothetical protein
LRFGPYASGWDLEFGNWNLEFELFRFGPYASGWDLEFGGFQGFTWLIHRLGIGYLYETPSKIRVST